MAEKSDEALVELCDFYLFQGKSDTTVMAMTVNPDAGVSSPDSFSQDVVYAFRFDLDGDGSEELAFKMQFKLQFDEESQKRVQTFSLRRAEGAHARAGTEGETIATGQVDQAVKTAHGVSVFAGLRPDIFAANKNALKAFLAALDEGRYAPDAFRAHDNTYAGRNIMAIVVEVPSKLLGQGKIHAWATVSTNTPAQQISRRGLPLLTDIFLADAALRRKYNEAGPSQDEVKFGGQIDNFIARITEVTGLTTSPADYAKKMCGRLLPSSLPYTIGSPTSFTLTEFNGRALGDDALDVMLNLATNTTISDGIAPDKSRIKNDFPYFGDPYTKFDSRAKE